MKIGFLDNCNECSRDKTCEYQRNNINGCAAFHSTEILQTFILRFSLAVLIIGVFAGVSWQLLVGSICTLLVIFVGGILQGLESKEKNNLTKES